MALLENKAGFLTPLNDKRTRAGGTDRTLVEPLVYFSALLGLLVTVPAGFVTDYASVPRAPLTYWLFGGVGDEAAVVHDFMYEKGIVPRDVADEVYAEALEACGVSAWRRGPMWAAVRLFGGSRYTPPSAKAA